jgi:hypothetical protein
MPNNIKIIKDAIIRIIVEEPISPLVTWGNSASEL